MNQREVAFLKLSQQFFEDKIDCAEMAKEMTLVLQKLVDTMYHAKVQDEAWRRHIEILVTKFIFHSSSLLMLSKGSEVWDDEGRVTGKYPDLPTIRLLMRGLVENYLTYFYLYVLPKNSEEGRFRVLLFEASGLNNRQKFEATSNHTLKRKSLEGQQLNDLKSAIQKNNYFLSLPSDEQKRLLKTLPARTMGWEKLIEESNLNTSFFKTPWKLYSNFAHSEFIGLLQMKDYFLSNPENLRKTVNFEFRNLCGLTAVFVKSLYRQYHSTELIYNSLPEETLVKIDFFYNITRDQNTTTRAII